MTYLAHKTEATISAEDLTMIKSAIAQRKALACDLHDPEFELEEFGDGTAVLTVEDGEVTARCLIEVLLWYGSRLSA